ncbi:hypothetical protein DPEC_G00294480 [Dallia pectoralis]|uniref:Uncharacterized protein n=1 Tax=Dallia pectoralis TaxID=75939 RepID=A0ACC2FIK4_DALPE|nr:hypothetical protein DPEC_G00294480 [Dallia pectoralis]
MGKPTQVCSRMSMKSLSRSRQICSRVVDVGGYGRTSDCGTLANSCFGEGLRDGTLDLPEDEQLSGGETRGPLPHIFVGDEAFPLGVNLMRPFPGTNIPREKRIFNYRLLG